MSKLQAWHPDRNARFEHIHPRVLSFPRRSQPVIPVGAKRKELADECKNPGQEWAIEGEPAPVNVHDFPDPRLGKAVPYWGCDLASNEGWVSVGFDRDKGRFAAASIKRWRRERGAARFPRATWLMITTGGGGSNSSRNGLWKAALQELADAAGLSLHMCHFPPGTSQWNKIEQRLFCFISKDWNYSIDPRR